MSFNLKLTKPQTEFFISKAKYTIFCGGFGSGKSESLFAKLLHDKFTNPTIDVGYFAPSYPLIRDLAYPRLLNALDQSRKFYKLNKSDNVIDVQKYGKIIMRSMDTPERIIGFEIGSAYVDEIDTMPFDDAEMAWNKIMARCRQLPVNPVTQVKDHSYINRVSAATTPEGYNFVYNRWIKNNPDPSQYKLIKASTTSNPYLPSDYVENLRASYPANLIEAYINGEFVNLNTRNVYQNFNRTQNDTDRTITPSDHTLHIGIDFNVMNTNGIVHLIDKPSHQAYAVDEFIRHKDTPDLINAIKEKYQNHKIYAYPDASGKSKKTVDASKSDISLLKSAGFYVKAPNKNPPVKDRLQAMNAMFLSGNGEIHYYVNQTTCPEYVSSLEQQTFDKNGSPKKDPTNSIDDINDAGGYCIVYNFPINRKQFSQARVMSY